MKKQIPISHQELILSPETYMLALPQGLRSYHSLFLEHSFPQIMASVSLSLMFLLKRHLLSEVSIPPFNFSPCVLFIH